MYDLYPYAYLIRLEKKIIGSRMKDYFTIIFGKVSTSDTGHVPQSAGQAELITIKNQDVAGPL